MKLSDLFKQVQEKNLTKDQLEDYYNQLTYLSAQMELSMSDLEKEEAIFFDTSLEETDVAKKRKWKVTESGQRQTTIKGQIKATDKMRASVKNRLYQIY